MYYICFMAKNKHLQFRVDEDFKKDLVKKATEENRSLSNYVEFVLRKDIYKLPVIQSFGYGSEVIVKDNQ